MLSGRFASRSRPVSPRRSSEADDPATIGLVILEPDVPTAARLLRTGRALEVVTLAWNVVGVMVLAVLAISTSSVALTGFGLDSLIEIGASAVVLWELSGTGEHRRQGRALRLIGIGVRAARGVPPPPVRGRPRPWGTARPPARSGSSGPRLTAFAMFGLAAGKRRTGRALDNPVLETEGRVTFVDGLLATAVLIGIVLDLALGWWWADPVAGLVIVFYAAREAKHSLTSGP